MSRRFAALAAVLSALVVLAGGCSSDTSDTVKVESPDGTVVAGSGDLPEGYPADQVPVIDGEVLVGVVLAGEGYQVTVASDLDAQAAFDEAVSVLEAAGVSAQDGEGLLGEQSAVLEGNGYSVLLSANESAGQTAVAYVVSGK